LIEVFPTRARSDIGRDRCFAFAAGTASKITRATFAAALTRFFWGTSSLVNVIAMSLFSSYKYTQKDRSKVRDLSRDARESPRARARAATARRVQRTRNAIKYTRGTRVDLSLPYGIQIKRVIDSIARICLFDRGASNENASYAAVTNFARRAARIASLRSTVSCSRCRRSHVSPHMIFMICRM